MGLGHICEGLAEQQNGGLVTLVLWNNQLSHQGMHYLSNALVSALCCLQLTNCRVPNIMNDIRVRIRNSLNKVAAT